MKNIDKVLIKYLRAKCIMSQQYCLLICFYKIVQVLILQYQTTGHLCSVLYTQSLCCLPNYIRNHISNAITIAFKFSVISTHIERSDLLDDKECVQSLILPIFEKKNHNKDITITGPHYGTHSSRTGPIVFLTINLHETPATWLLK